MDKRGVSDLKFLLILKKKRNTKEDFVAGTCLLKVVDERASKAAVAVLFVFEVGKK